VDHPAVDRKQALTGIVLALLQISFYFKRVKSYIMCIAWWDVPPNLYNVFHKMMTAAAIYSSRFSDSWYLVLTPIQYSAMVVTRLTVFLLKAAPHLVHVLCCSQVSCDSVATPITASKDTGILLFSHLNSAALSTFE
jgi:cellobiose-specific phosphotransferase system component IIC